MVDKILQSESEQLYISKSSIKDADRLSTALRDIDVKECSANGFTPIKALLMALANDDKTYTINMRYNDEPIAMFGVGNLNSYNYIWLLASEEFSNHKRDILKYSKYLLKEITKPYDFVFNVVHEENKTAIRWLKWMGVKFIRKININNEPFYEFIYV